VVAASGAAARFESGFTADDLAEALDLADAQDVRHRMRVLGRTGAYKQVLDSVGADAPIRSRRAGGTTHYWMTEWWRRAIVRVDEAR
jgi:hypothetical protein